MMLWHFVVISPAQSRAGRESLLRANGHETPLFICTTLAREHSYVEQGTGKNIG